MATYAILADVKTTLGIPSSVTNEDQLLSLVIQWCSDAITEWTGRNFASQSYTEVYCGNGTPYLPLNQRPVTAVASVYLDELAYFGQASGAFAASTELVQGQDYAIYVDQPDGSSRAGLLFNINGWWPIPINYTPGLITPVIGPPVGNIQVTYTAGYAAIPSQIEMACVMLVARVRKMRFYGQMLDSESYEEYSYKLTAPHPGMTAITAGLMSPEISSILARFREVAVG